LYRRRVDFFIKDRAFSIARAKAELGYAPKVDMEEGVHRTVAWYLEEGLI
ncbi:MAG TPA: oxidoreductase, partial [Armatimonadetes bacterium]|nr:oxidoreductase [Armatimonadota bacterium]